jgi:hypothetical protein
MPRCFAIAVGQLGRVARQPVRLDDGQHVALAQEGEALGELHPLGHAADLLAERALGAGRLQATLLRRQPGGPG